MHLHVHMHTQAHNCSTDPGGWQENRGQGVYTHSICACAASHTHVTRAATCQHGPTTKLTTLSLLLTAALHCAGGALGRADPAAVNRSRTAACVLLARHHMAPLPERVTTHLAPTASNA